MSTLQESINAIIDEYIPAKTFAEAGEIQKMIFNTFGVKCPRCGLIDQIYEWTVQTRSADEVSTIFRKCVCGHQWRV